MVGDSSIENMTRYEAEAAKRGNALLLCSTLLSSPSAKVLLLAIVAAGGEAVLMAAVVRQVHKMARHQRLVAWREKRLRQPINHCRSLGTTRFADPSANLCRLATFDGCCGPVLGAGP